MMEKKLCMAGKLFCLETRQQPRLQTKTDFMHLQDWRQAVIQFQKQIKMDGCKLILQKDFML